MTVVDSMLLRLLGYLLAMAVLSTSISCASIAYRVDVNMEP